MKLSKMNLLLVAAIVGAMILIERGNRVRIEAPAATDASAVTAVACPVNESVPFSQECMAFIQGGVLEVPHRIAAPLPDALPDSPELPGKIP